MGRTVNVDKLPVSLPPPLGLYRAGRLALTPAARAHISVTLARRYRNTIPLNGTHAVLSVLSGQSDLAATTSSHTYARRMSPTRRLATLRCSAGRAALVRARAPVWRDAGRLILNDTQDLELVRREQRGFVSVEDELLAILT